MIRILINYYIFVRALLNPMEEMSMSLINENSDVICRLDFYEDKRINGKLIELKFESVDVDGNLYIYDDEVTG